MPPLKPPGRAPSLAPHRRDQAIVALRVRGASLATLAAATGLTEARVDEIIRGRAPHQLQARHGQQAPH